MARTRTYAVSFGIVAGIGSLAACTLVTSLDGLAGTTGEGEAGALEAGPGDTGAGDTATIVDGGEAGSPSSFCAKHATAAFCADFEDGPFTQGWGETINNTGSFALVPAKTSRGLRVTIPDRTDANARASAAVAQTVTTGSATAFTCSFDMRIDSLAGTGIVDVGGFTFTGPFYSTHLRHNAVTGGYYLEEYGDPLPGRPAVVKAHLLTKGPAAGAWSHVAMKFTVDAMTSSATVTIDGEVVLADAPTDAWRFRSAPHVFGGIANAELAGSGTSVTVDDILVTTP